jgi:murein DD-endopeptidase MepM/ murein hydrolase activator NlpD
MKLLKQIFFILICSAVFLVGCPVENKENSQSQNQEGIQQLQRIYFDYPVRDEPIGKTENGQLYWDCCSDNDFCDIYNGEFHSGEDWNLKGGRNDIDEGRLVYSIGEGKVIYSKEEKVGFRVVIEHTGTCIIPSEENIKGSGLSYEEEIVDKIYSVYLHLKDLQVKVGDMVEIDDVIGKIKKYDPEVPPHLHFEIRKEWNNVYESYFSGIQQIIDLGFRDPSDFIEANMIVGKSSSQTIKEESIAIETETITEETSSGTVKNSGLIAFTSDSEIYVMNKDGSNQVNLTNNDTGDSYPCWSSDGSKIVFISDRDGNGEIYVMESDGNNQKRLTNTIEDEEYPCWSPDGNWIAFSRFDPHGDDLHVIQAVYIMESDGSNITRLTNEDVNNFQPSWSPDGSKIAFTSERDGNNAEIYVMNQDGSNQVNLTNDLTDIDFIPDWSPDGSKIAFTSYRDGNKEIYVMKSDGSNQVNITNNDDTDDNYPAWSPDGKWIAFSRFDNEALVARADIYITQLDGSDITQLTNNDRENTSADWH